MCALGAVSPRVFNDKVERFKRENLNLESAMLKTLKVFDSMEPNFGIWFALQEEPLWQFIERWKQLTGIVECSIEKHGAQPTYKIGFNALLNRIRAAQISLRVHLLALNLKLVKLKEHPNQTALLDKDLTQIHLDMAKIHVNLLESIAKPSAKPLY